MNIVFILPSRRESKYFNKIELHCIFVWIGKKQQKLQSSRVIKLLQLVKLGNWQRSKEEFMRLSKWEKKYHMTYVIDMGLVAESCQTLCNPMDGSPPGSSVHGDSPARILGRVAMPCSRRSPQCRDQTKVSHIVGGFFTVWATREAQEHWSG